MLPFQDHRFKALIISQVDVFYRKAVIKAQELKNYGGIQPSELAAKYDGENCRR